MKFKLNEARTKNVEELEQKLKNAAERVNTVIRTIEILNKAIKKATADNNTKLAKNLEKKKKELESLLDGAYDQVDALRREIEQQQSGGTIFDDGDLDPYDGSKGSNKDAGKEDKDGKDSEETDKAGSNDVDDNEAGDKKDGEQTGKGEKEGDEDETGRTGAKGDKGGKEDDSGQSKEPQNTEKNGSKSNGEFDGYDGDLDKIGPELSTGDGNAKQSSSSASTSGDQQQTAGEDSDDSGDDKDDQDDLDDDQPDNKNNSKNNSSNKSKSSKPPEFNNPFEDPDFNNIDMSDMQGGDMPRDPTIDELIQILQKLKGEERRGAVDGLKQLLDGNKAKLTDSLHLTEAKQSIIDMSSDAFNDLINGALDMAETTKSYIEVGDEDERVSRIKQWLEDPATVKELEQEDKINKARDSIKGRRSEVKRYYPTTRYKNLEAFKINFYRAIKDQVEMAEQEEDSYLVFNRRHDDDPNILLKGQLIDDKIVENSIPIVRVYFDQSGSWDNDDIKTGEEAISVISEFDRKGEIQLEVLYFSNVITTSKNDSRLRSGTGAWPYILKDIKASGANNVVIMTDSDMNSSATYHDGLTVNGCVWYIWKNETAAPALPEKLRGKRGTFQFAFRTKQY